MMNTIERTFTTASDSVTERLDALEKSLPEIPSKALAASRASVRRANDVVGSAASSVRSRMETVGDEAGAAAATSKGRARSNAEKSPDPDEIASWTKSELYERAQELDIEGRSGMTKAELIGALQKS